MGDEIKEFLKRRSTKKIIIIVIIVAMVFVVLSGSAKEVTTADGIFIAGDKANAPYVADDEIDKAISEVSSEDSENKELKTLASADGGYKLDINIENVAGNIVDRLDMYGGRLDIYITTISNKELMKKLVKAELATQYPDLRTADKIGTPVTDSSEFQGVIKFIRHKSDGTTQTLQYIPLGESTSTGASTLYGLINQASGNTEATSEEVTNAVNTVLNYFSIDGDGNLIVAKSIKTTRKTVEGSYETEYKQSTEQVDYMTTDKAYLDGATEVVEYSYSTHKINYKTSLSQYTMPFEYLWAFLVCGRDDKFVSQLADLVLDSKIEVGVYDSISEYEDLSILSYNTNNWTKSKEVKIEKTRNAETGAVSITKQEEGLWSDPATITTTHNYQISYTKTASEKVTVAVENADIWYMKATGTLTLETTEPTNPGLVNYEITRDTEQDEEFEEGTQASENIEYVQGTEVQEGSSGNVTKYKRTDLLKQTKNNQYSLLFATNTVERNYNTEGNLEITEKIDTTLKEGDEGYPNFCALYFKSDSAKNNIYGTEEWLFEILERNEATVNMVDLTKYLLYCATDMDFGVKEFAYTGVFALNAANKIYGGSAESRLWFELIDEGFFPEAAAGAMANIYHESEFFSGNLENKYNEQFGITDEEYTARVDNGAYTKEQFIGDSAGYGLAQWTSRDRKEGLYDFWQSKVQSGQDISISDTNLQIEYLIGEITPHRDCEYADFGFQEVWGYNYKEWQEAFTPEEAALAYCVSFERPQDSFERGKERGPKAREYYEKYKDLKAQEFIANENVYVDGYSGIYTSSTGRTYYEYKQNLGPWADKEYGIGVYTSDGRKQTVSNVGCYATSMAILESSADTSTTPETMRQRRNTTGGVSMDEVAEKTGMRYEYASADRNKIIQHLQNGGVVLTYHHGEKKGSSSIYTRNQHWMLIIDINEDGSEVYLSNPSSLDKTGWQSMTDIMKGLQYVYLWE